MSDMFSEKMLSEYEAFEIVIKLTNHTGYIYILKDSLFPNHIKIGKTSNLKKRLGHYNGNKPYSTARYVYISKVFEDKDTAETRILDYLYSQIPSTTFTKEWFEIHHEDFIRDVLNQAEKELS